MPLEIFSVMKLHSLVKMLVKDSTQCVEKKTGKTSYGLQKK